MDLSLWTGINVFSHIDRYLYTNVAYSMARGCSKDQVWHPAIGLPAADLVIYPRVPIPTAINRKDPSKLEVFEKSDFQELVVNNFEDLISDKWLVVDGTLSVERVHGLILSELSIRLSI